MSLVLRIGTTTDFDGSTVVDLSGAVQDPSTRVFSAAFDAVGLIPLWTFAPLGARDIWLQHVSPVGIGGGVTLSMVFPSGEELIPLAGGSAPFNIVLPQGALLRFQSVVAGAVTLWMHGINDKTYPDLACCHQYNPKLGVQPPPV